MPLLEVKDKETFQPLDRLRFPASDVSFLVWSLQQSESTECLSHHFVRRPDAGSPASLCRCAHSLCAGPVVHKGAPVQPVLCPGLNPPAPQGNIHLDWTCKHTSAHGRGSLLWVLMSAEKHYLDIVTSVGLGRAFRICCTAETSLSISSSVLTWCGSSTESQVNPA